MDAKCVGGLIYIPLWYWGKLWFDQNHTIEEQSVCEQYVIKKFKPATTRKDTITAACLIFDSGNENKDKNVHVTQLDLDNFKQYGMKIGIVLNISTYFFCLYLLFIVTNNHHSFCVVGPSVDEPKTKQKTSAKRKIVGLPSTISHLLHTYVHTYVVVCKSDELMFAFFEQN